MLKTTPTEAAASLLGIAGAVLIGGAWSMAGGFAMFLASNLAALLFFARRRHWAMFAQQLVYVGTSVLGLWTWWLAPAMGM